MADIKYSRVRELAKLGREVIELPSDINFAGNEVLQKTPGDHHRPEYQETGTYYHPNLCKQRLRVAKDRLERMKQFKASDYEQRNFKVDKLEKAVKRLSEELAIVLSGGNPQEDTIVYDDDKPAKATKKKGKGKQKKAEVTSGEDMDEDEIEIDDDSEEEADPKAVVQAAASAKKANDKGSSLSSKHVDVN